VSLRSAVRFASPLFAFVAAACGGPTPNQPGLSVVADEAIDAPLRNASEAEHERFIEGDALFDLTFRPSDGLGPLYIRAACSACHADAANGPGAVQKMVVVEADGRTPAADQSALSYGHTVRPYYTAGAHTPITPPEQGVLVTRRLGPAVYGRGYIEAIADSEIERVAAAQQSSTDGVSGRINRVTFTSQPNPDSPFHKHVYGESGLIGRFGLKARIATVDDFTADAFQGDMGLTSDLRPDELVNPDGKSDDSKPGVDVDLDTLNATADYLRLLEIPKRAAPSDEAIALFDRAQCSSCHIPSMRTRADYPIASLADIEAPIYSDLLLHDMGDALADGLTDGSAGPREWKTAPLMGLRYFRAYLHDGRAPTLRDAVLMHEGPGSEANGSVAAFKGLSSSEQEQLLEFISTL
jgi:CxxC motif-containing protein (DUF1111 family)